MNKEKYAVIAAFTAVLATVLAVPLFRLTDRPTNGAATQTPPAPPAQDGSQFRGIWLQVHNDDPSCPFEQYVREIASTGANTVCFAIAAEQENGSATTIYADRRKMPSRERLINLFKITKSLDKKIIFMPIVLLTRPASDEWRGKINPDNWDEWWQSYFDYILEYAAIAQENGVDLFMIGSELISTERFEDRWQTLINLIRQQSLQIIDRQFRRHLKQTFTDYTAHHFKDQLGIDDIETFAFSQCEPDILEPTLVQEYRSFAGQRKMLLCYSANWDHYTVPKWWDKLDALGMTSYHKLNANRDADPSLENLLTDWQPVKREIVDWQSKLNKPVFFTEVGWASQDGCSIEPWNYFHSTTVDLVEQQRCMDSFLKTFGHEPWVGGILIWKWRDNPQVIGGATDIGYTPYGKPVMETIRQFFASPNPPTTSMPAQTEPASQSQAFTDDEPIPTQPAQEE